MDKMLNNVDKSPARLFKMMSSELDHLRNELYHLKECQLKYVTLGITSSGASAVFCFGIANEVAPSILFLPVAISIPFWCIYFDKAVTITRIVGYYRVLERFLLAFQQGTMPISECNNPLKYIGWENAVRKARDSTPVPKTQNVTWQKFRKLILFQFEYNYWIINWVTFVLICVMGVFGAVAALAGNATLRRQFSPFDYLICAMVIIAAYLAIRYTTVTLDRLVGDGIYSYRQRELWWEHVLSSEETCQRQDERPPAGILVDVYVIALFVVIAFIIWLVLLAPVADPGLFNSPILLTLAGMTGRDAD